MVSSLTDNLTAHNIALWEVAGTAHGDVYNIALSVGPQDIGDDPAVAEVVEVSAPIPGIIECDVPINSGPQHWVMNAADPRTQRLGQWRAATTKTKRTLVGDRRRRIRR